MTRRGWTAPLWFALLALVASLPRFGQRENPGLPLSDSDYYLDMAAVMAGERPSFDPEWSDPEYYGAHHYGRPLLPLLVGSVARALPGASLPALFSAVAVVAAWTVAVALHLVLVRAAPGLRLPWLPSALFLTGFPQVNWGYHVLTDTLGYATAFLAAWAAWAVIERGRVTAATLAGVFVLQALAFLARETAWFVPIVLGWVLLVRRRREESLRPGLAVLAVVLLAALPHRLYLRALELRSIEIPFTPGAWASVGYVGDFVIKSLVAFHLLWLVAVVGWRSAGRPRMPVVLVGWSLAALAYMAAGYAHNRLDDGGIGYPLRLTWALFPAVLFLTACAVDRVEVPSRRRAAAVGLVVLNLTVAMAGTLLDRGATGVTIPALIERARPER